MSTQIGPATVEELTSQSWRIFREILANLSSEGTFAVTDLTYFKAYDIRGRLG
jgi:hypothetical protein